MPDMAHAVSFEANVYNDYYWNHWDKESVVPMAQLMQPRGIVSGTVPRGYVSVYHNGAGSMDVLYGRNASNAISTPVNGAAPFPYANTEEERLRCEQEMLNNPFPITQRGLDQAKPLYDIYCGVCHGAKGDGQGILVTVPNAKYPAQPRNLIADDMISAGNGRLYFAVMYGKNVMGGYSDKLSFEERWQVIHYVRSLQAKAKNLTYDETANTLNDLDKPANGAASGPKPSPAPATAPVAAPGN